MIDEIIIYGNIFTVLIELIINLKQTIKLFKAKPDEKTKLIIKDDDEFHKMRKYNIEKLILGNIQSIFMIIKLIYIINKNLYLKSYEYTLFRLPGLNKYLIQIIFLRVFMFIENIICIPFSICSTFFIEQKYGFNKMSISLFIVDFIKGEVLLTIIIPICIYIVLYLIDLFPQSFYVQVFIAVSLIQLTMVVLYPILIQPMFNKFEPLDEGSLKNKIIELAKEVGFKPSMILKMDESKRSHHSNAYFIGLFKEKRIVLYDTLIKQTKEPETLAILCHEFGHWFYNHMWKNISFSFSIMFGYLYAFNFFVKQKSFMYEFPMILRLNYFMLLTVFINPLLTLIQNSIVRMYERQADVFAVKKGFGEQLKKGLINIHVENKGNICPDSWYSTYNHSHPTLSERLDLIDREMKKIK